MDDYYRDKLAADRLRACYDIATPRVRQYLQAETAHVVSLMGDSDAILELGCGYGRALRPLAAKARFAVGIDNSMASLALARDELRNMDNCELVAMDASRLGLTNEGFDVVACLQNGVSAFHVDLDELMREALRVTRTGGRALFSTYAERFWPARLEWFELQAQAGLLGAIDHDKTGDGVIVCKDGFAATTVTPTEFEAAAARLGVHADLIQIDDSSLFCEITK